MVRNQESVWTNEIPFPSLALIGRLAEDSAQVPVRKRDFPGSRLTTVGTAQALNGFANTGVGAMATRKVGDIDLSLMATSTIYLEPRHAECPQSSTVNYEVRFTGPNKQGWQRCLVALLWP